MRVFETGATRDTDEDKLDYEGFLSPEVLEVFAEYMHKNREMKDGSLRESDNWQKGIPKEELMKSLLRHVMAVWLAHRRGEKPNLDDLCGVSFNTQGLILDTIRKEQEYEKLDEVHCCEFNLTSSHSVQQPK